MCHEREKEREREREREKTFYLQTKIDTVGLIGRLVLVGYWHIRKNKW